MSIQVTMLSYADSLKEAAKNNELYIMNNSAGRNERPRGIIHMSMKDGDRETAIQIPATWYPVNLLEHFSLDALKVSSNYRDLIREKHIVAIKKEEAERIMQSSDAQREKQRWKDVEDSKPGRSASNRSEGMIEIVTGGGEAAVAAPATPHNPLGNADANAPSPQLVELVERFNRGDVNDELASQTLSTLYQQGKVSVQQLQMGISAIRNTTSVFYQTIESILSDPSSSGRVVHAGSGGGAAQEDNTASFS